MKKINVEHLKQGDIIIEYNAFGEEYEMLILNIIVGEDTTSFERKSEDGMIYSGFRFNDDQVLIKN